MDDPACAAQFKVGQEACQMEGLLDIVELAGDPLIDSGKSFDG